MSGCPNPEGVRMNILTFLPAEAYRPKGGGEYTGPCPRCGGTDRFIVWPQHPSGAAGGKYLCRHCAPSGGDGIQFLRDFRDMSFAEAREALRLPPSSARQKVGRVATPSWTPKESTMPGEAWQTAAAAFLSECCRNIEGEDATAFLQSRGLTLDTARRFLFGWNSVDRFHAPEVWGLDRKKVFLPAGLVIPTRRKAGLCALNIRRAVVPDGRAKYHLVRGSVAVAFVHGKPGLPCVIVEGELDAAIIVQEAPGLCSVVAIPAGNKPDMQTAAFIRSAPAVLYAGDFDDAGKKEFRWWREHFPCRAWPPAYGKDVGDMHKAGVSVRVWLELGIAQAHATSPPAASSRPEREGNDVNPARHKNGPDYSTCPDYWRGCLNGCPDADLIHADGPMAGNLNSNFCRRHAPPPWARVLQ